MPRLTFSRRLVHNRPVLNQTLNDKERLDARLRAYLRDGGLGAGDRVPGEREIATALGVGRTALRPLLNGLEREGVIERRPQSGTVLLRPPGMRTPRDASIALIAPFYGTDQAARAQDSAWLLRLAAAFERAIAPVGARLLFLDQSSLATDPCSIKDLARRAASDGAKAAVLLHPAGTRDKISCALALLHDRGVHPVIVSSRTYPGLASQVYFDSAWGAYRATRFLWEQGHRCLGFAGAPGGHEWVRERLQGFHSALEAATEGDSESADLLLPEPWVWLPEETSERPIRPLDGEAAFVAWCAQPQRTRPTALVAANDVVAIGFLNAARAAGVAVPGDVSLIGFDNDPEALFCGLTTMERPTEALGEATARITLERLADGPEAATVTHRLRPRIVERTTVAPLSTKIY